MKKFKFLSFALASMFLFSCSGNKDAKSNPEEKKDSSNVVANPDPELKEPVVEEMVLSLTMADDPCGMGSKPDLLHIKGGKAFDDKKKPYKVTAKNTEEASAKLGKFIKEKDGTYTLDIGSMSNADDEVKIKLTVIDAAGTEKTIIYVIPHCL